MLATRAWRRASRSEGLPPSMSVVTACGLPRAASSNRPDSTLVCAARRFCTGALRLPRNRTTGEGLPKCHYVRYPWTHISNLLCSGSGTGRVSPKKFASSNSSSSLNSLVNFNSDLIIFDLDPTFDTIFVVHGGSRSS